LHLGPRRREPAHAVRRGTLAGRYLRLRGTGDDRREFRTRRAHPATHAGVPAPRARHRGLSLEISAACTLQEHRTPRPRRIEVGERQSPASRLLTVTLASGAIETCHRGFWLPPPMGSARLPPMATTLPALMSTEPVGLPWP